jgi:diguanylate cyclase (GGDEF)-like protein
MLGMLLLAYQEVARQRDAAQSAATVSNRVTLLQHAGRVIVPLYLEFTATDGVSQAELQGIDRTVLNEVIGLDFLGLITQSRVDLDQSLDDLDAATGGMRLVAGGILRDELEAARADLQRVRTQFDAHNQDPAEVTAAFTRFVDLLAQLSGRSGPLPAPSATTSELAGIGAQSEQFLATLTAAAINLRLIAEAGVSGGERAKVLDAMLAVGRFDASLERFGALLSAEQRVGFDELLTEPSFVDVNAAFPDLVGALTTAEQVGAEIIETPSVVNSIIAVLAASFDRLADLQEFGNTFLDEGSRRAQQIETEAQSARQQAITVMLVALGGSLLLLALVLHSILRPLRRLVRQSRQVGDGDLALAPLKPTGPTDFRVVMRTFNEMVTTLRSYDAQVHRLALGDTSIDPTLPGPLGDTLRQSVSHLATVTAKLHASEAAANQQARTDALTGLANRTAALEHLTKLAMNARHVDGHGAVVFLDLDGFKSVNDTQGHAEGDRILGEIGERLKAACPEHVVARIGGDEFIVLVDEVSEIDQVTALARRLIEIVSAPCTGSSGQLFTITASAGVAMIAGQRDPLAYIARADSAVYHAKERGRGRVEVYDARLARDIEDRADMALTMRQGLVAGQFSIKLQPIIDIATKEPIGAEALVRWNRPGIGEVGPNEFIPVAERTGVILDLDAWVLEQAVGVLRSWQDDPNTAKLRMAVNISGRHIVDGTLSPLLARLCERAGVDPAMLDLEITETHLVADVARASAVVDDLREQGIKVAIDDFGTGYSSMSYLHQLTVDTLKIDQVFVAGMCDNALDRSIVELLLRLGDSLGLKVVAEGVDSADKLAELQLLGCPWAQGFYIARPMSIADATVWLRQQVTLATLL